jgi:hypothetical protein
MQRITISGPQAPARPRGVSLGSARASLARVLRGGRPPQPALKPIVPAECTVEPEGRALLRELIEATHAIPGPIIEIGTLLGVTTTDMALWKASGTRILTVDNFAWNPWGLTSDQHRDLTCQVLRYLTCTGHVEMVISNKDAFYETYTGPAPALVFLDAIHTREETSKDIAWARQVGARIITGHDYGPQFPGVIEAVEDVGGPAQLAGTVWRL